MQVIDITLEHATAITAFGSGIAYGQPLAGGTGEADVHAVHFPPGGEIGRHPAGFGQLFPIVAGEGWVAGGDGVRHALRAGHRAAIARGELHAKGSDSGCSAVMIQLGDLALRA
jgi:quercetin dioxygenase-like cupin family protein